MAYLAIRTGVNYAVAGLTAASDRSRRSRATVAPQARADAVAYLVNVTVRPGLQLPQRRRRAGLRARHLRQSRRRRTYAQLVDDVKADFGTTDEYQAGYLINQAVNELCPAMIWQLRNSAANYRPAVP